MRGAHASNKCSQEKTNRFSRRFVLLKSNVDTSTPTIFRNFTINFTRLW